MQLRRRPPLISILIILILTIGGLPIMLGLGIEQMNAKAAQNIIVDINGNGQYSTIQGAVNNSNPGDTIFIKGGEYNERVIINKPLSIIGDGRLSTLINGSGDNVLTIESGYVKIKNMAIRSGFNKFSGIMINGSSIKKYNNCEISNIIVKNCKYGIISKFSNKNIISNNSIINNEFEGVYLHCSSNNKINDNELSVNRFGIYSYNSRNNIIFNNNFVSNNFDGIFLDFSNKNQIINNNIIYNQMSGIHLGFSENNSISNNNLNYNNWGVSIDSSNYNVLNKNSASNNKEFGINLIRSNYNLIRSIKTNENKIGLFSDNSHYNTIKNSNCLKNSYGYYFFKSENNNVIRNIVNTNQYSGIIIDNSEDYPDFYFGINDYYRHLKNKYFVSTQGNDSNSGTTEAEAWRSIVYAAQMAQPGDIVYIKSGNYAGEEVVVQHSGNYDNPIIFQGYHETPGDNPAEDEYPILDGGSKIHGFKIKNKNYVKIRYIKLLDYSFGIFIENSNHISISNVCIRGTKSNEDYHGIYLLKSNYCHINYCNVTNCDMSNFYLHYSNFNLIENCGIPKELSTISDYYYGISNSYNNIIRNCSSHKSGHGIGIKDQYNKNTNIYLLPHSYSNRIIKCKSFNHGTEALYIAHKAHNNYFVNCFIYNESRENKENAVCIIRDGANNNKLINCRGNGPKYGVTFGNSIEGPKKEIIDPIKQFQNNNSIENCIFENLEIGFITQYSSNNLFKNNVFNNLFYTFANYPTMESSNNSMRNCIISNIHGSYYYQSDRKKIKVTYSNHYNINNLNTVPSGIGNTMHKPLYADSDYHLKSEYGRWDGAKRKWIIDISTSPCIDLGDPNDNCSKEIQKPGRRINMGAYGNTPQASKGSDYNYDGQSEKLRFLGNNKLDDNYVNSNDANGIILLNSRRNFITNNTCFNNLNNGLKLDNSDDNIIVYNEFLINGQNGILIHSSKNITITKTTSKKNGNGILFDKVSNSILSNNLITYNKKGMYLTNQSENNIINMCNITKNSQGIVFTHQSNANVFNNSVYDNFNTGINNTDPEVLVLANNNWWGSNHGPYDPSDDRKLNGWYNPFGEGNRVSDHVKYKPWQGFRNLPPHIINIDVPVITKNSVYEVYYKAEDPNHDFIYWKFESNANWLCWDPITHRLFGIPQDDDIGNYWVCINITDNLGGYDEHNFTLYVFSEVPKIITKNKKIAFEDQLYSNKYSINVNSIDQITWKLDTDPSWLNINSRTGLLSGTPENSDIGQYKMIIIALKNEYIIDTIEFKLVVKNTNDAPVIETKDILSVKEDNFYNVQYSASDVDADDNLIWSIETNSTWLQWDSSKQLLIGTPRNKHVGKCWVRIKVTDNSNMYDEHNFTINVQNVNDVPVITGLPDELVINGQENNSFDLTKYITDVDNDLSELMMHVKSNFITFCKIEGFKIYFDYPNKLIYDQIEIIVTDLEDASAAHNVIIKVIPNNLNGLVVTEKSPIGDNVPISTDIFVTFCNNMDTMITNIEFSMLPIVDGEFKLVNNVLNFKPYSNLEYNITYEVTLDFIVSDLKNFEYELSYSWRFTTIVFDTDCDNILDYHDIDDDNDNFLDYWEEHFKTDSKDKNHYPIDTDYDGIPNGDPTNSQHWMDLDDDGDGITDELELILGTDPLDRYDKPANNKLAIKKDTSISSWIGISVIVIIIIPMVFFIFKAQIVLIWNKYRRNDIRKISSFKPQNNLSNDDNRYR